jgi:Domain of unknown function (DUF5658)
MGCEKYRTSKWVPTRWCCCADSMVSRTRSLRRRGWLLWLLFIGLQIADVVTTNYALAVPGNWEANPIMHLFQIHLGAAWWLPKIAAVVMAAGITAGTSRTWPILFAVSYYVIIVSGNLACL